MILCCQVQMAVGQNPECAEGQMEWFCLLIHVHVRSPPFSSGVIAVVNKPDPSSDSPSRTGMAQFHRDVVHRCIAYVFANVVSGLDSPISIGEL
ncbi:MAG: hypothetical protein CVT49_07475 [candidate division Zixibacteria bacterium HGW-Zixibacteria-1]|nr:MAG: hypothetical protein CVT49_07475 [candidate division Zixibacteria bacterium HGW-Zixibacteria-1]